MNTTEQAVFDEVEFAEGVPKAGAVEEPQETETAAPAKQETKEEPEPKQEEYTSVEKEVVSAEPTEAEKKAAELGWSPKEQWRGDPGKWVDAETYLDRSEQVLPLLKKDRERLFGTVEELRQQLKDFQKYHEEDRERLKKREYDRALSDLKAQMKSAVEEGDVQKYETLEADRDKLDKEYKESAEQKPGAADTKGMSKNLREWANRPENSWFGRDWEKTQCAYAVSSGVLWENQDKGWKGDEIEFFEAVARKADEKLAELKAKEAQQRKNGATQNPRRSEPSAVQPGDTPRMSRSTRTRTYGDLDAEAKGTCDRLVRAGLMTRDKFVSEYFGDNKGIVLED